MKVKVIQVQGEVINRGGVRVKTLPENIEKAVNEALPKIKGEVVDIQTETDFGSIASGGTALVVIKYSPSAEDSKKKDK